MRAVEADAPEVDVVVDIRAPVGGVRIRLADRERSTNDGAAGSRPVGAEDCTVDVGFVAGAAEEILGFVCRSDYIDPGRHAVSGARRIEVRERHAAVKRIPHFVVDVDSRREGAAEQSHIRDGVFVIFSDGIESMFKITILLRCGVIGIVVGEAHALRDTVADSFVKEDGIDELVVEVDRFERLFDAVVAHETVEIAESIFIHNEFNFTVVIGSFGFIVRNLLTFGENIAEPKVHIKISHSRADVEVLVAVVVRPQDAAIEVHEIQGGTAIESYTASSLDHGILFNIKSAGIGNRLHVDNHLIGNACCGCESQLLSKRRLFADVENVLRVVGKSFSSSEVITGDIETAILNRHIAADQRIARRRIVSTFGFRFALIDNCGAVSHQGTRIILRHLGDTQRAAVDGAELLACIDRNFIKREGAGSNRGVFLEDHLVGNRASIRVELAESQVGVSINGNGQ